jgi:hypothetical protein
MDWKTIGSLIASSTIFSTAISTWINVRLSHNSQRSLQRSDTEQKEQLAALQHRFDPTTHNA